MHPVRGGQQPLVVTVRADQLQAHGQAAAPARKRQVYAGQASQGPAAAKQRVTGAVKAQGRFAQSARGQQHVHTRCAEEVLHLGARVCGCLQMLCVSCAVDGQALRNQRLQWRAQGRWIALKVGLQGARRVRGAQRVHQVDDREDRCATGGRLHAR